MKNNRGQTLMEMLIVVTVLIVLLTALIALSLSSLKTTLFNTRKAQATKFAQEGIEIARKERDKGWVTFYAYAKGPTVQTWCMSQDVSVFADLIAPSATPPACPKNVDPLFTRSIVFHEVGINIETTVTVSWQDGSGTHNSKIGTIFTQWQ